MSVCLFGRIFGELVFVRRLEHTGIVRFVEMQVVEQVAAIRELIERHAEAMRMGALIVVTQRRVRIRVGTRDERGND